MNLMQLLTYLLALLRCRWPNDWALGILAGRRKAGARSLLAQDHVHECGCPWQDVYHIAYSSTASHAKENWDCTQNHCQCRLWQGFNDTRWELRHELPESTSAPYLGKPISLAGSMEPDALQASMLNNFGCFGGSYHGAHIQGP